MVPYTLNLIRCIWTTVGIAQDSDRGFILHGIISQFSRLVTLMIESAADRGNRSSSNNLEDISSSSWEQLSPVKFVLQRRDRCIRIGCSSVDDIRYLDHTDSDDQEKSDRDEELEKDESQEEISEQGRRFPNRDG